MSNDDLTTLLNQFTRALVDPTAPLPSLWPGGAFGVFLIFVTQIGAGIPLGVIMARNAGIAIPVTALLYLASDVVLAITTEPMLLLLRWMGRRVEFLGRLGNRLARFTGMAGMQTGRVRGPLGVIIFSFAWAPAPARAASEAAGFGPIRGWTLAIIGDMAYFGLIMASTLWVSSLFGGDDRMTVGAVLLGTWLLPIIIRRMRRAAKPAARTPAPLRVATAGAPALGASVAEATTTPRPRRTVAHNGRRRRQTRGLHR
jgi:hypothetical protein